MNSPQTQKKINKLKIKKMKMKLKWKKEWNWPVLAIAGITGTFLFKTAYDRKAGELKNERMKNAGLMQQHERMVYHLGKNETMKNQTRKP